MEAERPLCLTCADLDHLHHREFDRESTPPLEPIDLRDLRVTTQNVEVVSTDADRGLILIRGAVPGVKGAWILVRDAAKVALPANAPKPAAIRAAAVAKNDAPATEGAE